MELAIPFVALASLYVAFNQKSDDRSYDGDEGFHNKNDFLPNTDIPNRNYPGELPILNEEIDQTSLLSTVNKTDTNSVYSDKYFNPNAGGSLTNIGLPGGGDFYSLTGDKVGGDYFQHNNMVPFFGSTLRTRLVDENTNESLIDNMTGAGSQIYSKKEQAPLFSPTENMQWAHGMPSYSDFEQSRMNVSTKMSNVKPFEEVRVRPGLGNDGETSLGFNSGMMARDMWMPKTADQLRAANNQKASGLSLEGFEGAAISRITNMGFEGHLEKNRPDRFFAVDSSRYMTTTGAAGQAQTLHSLPLDRTDPIRASSAVSYQGGAGAQVDGTYIDGEYMESKRMQLGALPLAPVDGVGRSGARENDYSVNSFKKYTNNRSTTIKDDYFGAIGGAFGAAVAPLLDALRPSKRQNAIGSMRPYQNPESTVKTGHLFNPADRPAPTLREMTEDATTGFSGVNSGQRGMGYVAAKQTPAHTSRQETGDFFYGGNGATVNAKQMRNYDAEYKQRNNVVKSSIIAGTGYTPSGGMALLNGDVNVRTNAVLENDLEIRRKASASMPYQSPDATAMGRMTGAQPLYSGMQMDRSNPEILSSLKSNPYHLSVLGGV
jgi:hypothetical protein